MKLNHLYQSNNFLYLSSQKHGRETRSRKIISHIHSFEPFLVLEKSISGQASLGTNIISMKIVYKNKIGWINFLESYHIITLVEE